MFVNCLLLFNIIPKNSAAIAPDPFINSVNTYTRTPYAQFADQDTIKFEKLMEAFQEMNQRISIAV